jgi:anti-anti-sigma factor
MVNGVPVVVAPQEIDAHNADCLRAVLLQAACGHATFVVDMTGTQFCASAGLSVLVRAHKRALADGGELRLVIPASAAVLRVFALTGIDRLIPNFTDLQEALEPAPAAAPRPGRRKPQHPGLRAQAATQGGPGHATGQRAPCSLDDLAGLRLARCPLIRDRVRGSGQGPSPRLSSRDARLARAPVPRRRSQGAGLSPSRRPGTSGKPSSPRR